MLEPAGARLPPAPCAAWAEPPTRFRKQPSYIAPTRFSLTKSKMNTLNPELTNFSGIIKTRLPSLRYWTATSVLPPETTHSFGRNSTAGPNMSSHIKPPGFESMSASRAASPLARACVSTFHCPSKGLRSGGNGGKRNTFARTACASAIAFASSFAFASAWDCRRASSRARSSGESSFLLSPQITCASAGDGKSAAVVIDKAPTTKAKLRMQAAIVQPLVSNL